MSDAVPEPIRSFRDGPQCWWMLEGERERLLDPKRPAQLRSGVETHLKKVRAKILSRLEITEPAEPRTVYVKRYLARNYFWRPLKYLFRTSPAMMEWRLSLELKRRGVPVVRHLAVGETRRCGLLQEAVLVTEGWVGALDIETYLWKYCGQNPQAIPVRFRQNLARVLGRFMRLLHDQGVVHLDLHPANILIRVVSEMPELWLVDLDGVELHPGMDWPARMTNLALLYNYFGPRSHRSDRLRFLQAYLGERDASRLLELARQLETLCEQGIKAYRRQRAFRCQKSNRDFGVVRKGGLRWQVRWSALDGKLETVLDGPEKLFSQPNVLLKQSASATIGRALGYFIKRSNHRKPIGWIKDLFRSSRAEKAYQKAYHLELCGIATPMAVAWAERRTLDFLRQSYLVTVQLPGALDLSRLVIQKIALTPVDRQLIRRRVARLIAALHDAGFSHRDLKTQNIMAGPGPDWPVWLVDLDGLTDLNDVPAERALKDLARLDRGAREILRIGTRERLRFFVEYRRALRDRRLRSALMKRNGSARSQNSGANKKD